MDASRAPRPIASLGRARSRGLPTTSSDRARAGVNEYWVVDGPTRRLIQHLGPTPDGYTRIETLAADATVQAQAGGAPVELKQLFG